MVNTCIKLATKENTAKTAVLVQKCKILLGWINTDTIATNVFVYFKYVLSTEFNDILLLKKILDPIQSRSEIQRRAKSIRGKTAYGFENCRTCNIKFTKYKKTKAYLQYLVGCLLVQIFAIMCLGIDLYRF